MKKASIAELKNHLSRFLRYVKEGEPVVVLDRGVPVAEIQPRIGRAAGLSPSKDEERLRRLEAKGIIRRGRIRGWKNFPFPPEGGSTGVLEALLEERRSGR